MKQGTAITRFVMIVLFVGIVLYFGFYAVRSLQDPFTTAVAYSYTVDDGVEASGLLVRQEMVLPARSGIVALTAGEGEKVAKGQAVAVLYSSTAAQERAQQIRALELEAEQLEYALTGAGGGGTAARLDEDIADSILKLRAAAAENNLTNLESQVLELKSGILKREYTYGTGDIGALTGQLAQLRLQLTDLRRQARQDTTAITAERSGVFSTQADGYESLVTPEDIFTLTPDEVDRLMAVGESDQEALGKLITDSRWYFVAVLPVGDAERLTEGRRATVSFSRDWSGDVIMQVESLSDPQDGRVTAVFSSTRSLAETTLLRRQTVDIVFDRETGVRVPREALRVDEEGNPGVFCVVGRRAEFKSARVLAEGEDYYVLTAAVSDRTSLRPGDEVIVRATGLYDGKVVR